MSMKLAYFYYQSAMIHTSIIFVCLIFAICVIRFFEKKNVLSYTTDETVKSDRYGVDFCLRNGNQSMLYFIPCKFVNMYCRHLV